MLRVRSALLGRFTKDIVFLTQCNGACIEGETCDSDLLMCKSFVDSPATSKGEIVDALSVDVTVE